MSMLSNDQLTGPLPRAGRNIWLRDKNLYIGILLLILAAGLGYTALLYSSFGDEGDSVAAALLVSKGYVLYRDIFSHHFPFVYYWVALFFKILHPSIRVARFSVFVFQYLTFFSLMLCTHKYKAVGLAALLWSSIGFLYFGNMALYQSILPFACLPLLVIPLTANHQGTVDFGWVKAASMAVFAAVAFLTNPLAAIPAACTWLYLILKMHQYKKVAVMTLVFSASIGSYLLYLVLSGSMSSFYESAILFNQQIYPKYNSAANVQVNLLNAVTHVLYLFGTDRQLFPYDLSSAFTQATIFVLSGTLFRLIVLLGCLALLVRRRYLDAVFVYLFTAGSLIRYTTNFDNQALVLISLTLLAFSTILSWEDTLTGLRAQLGKEGSNLGDRLIMKPSAVVAGLCAAMCIWFVSEGVIYRLNAPDSFNYKATFKTYLADSGKISALACGKPAALGYFPGDPYYYFFTGMPPVSGYIYLWPWVAEVGTQDVLRGLEKDQSVVIYIDKEGSVWGRSNKVYLAPIIEYIDHAYIPVGGSYYVSPGLYHACRQNTN